MLQKKEINDLFDTLKLSTPADREQFLRFERLSGETNLAQDGTNEELRVLFGDSTALVFGYGGALRARELGISVGGDAQLGCGIVRTGHVTHGRVEVRPAGSPTEWLGAGQSWTNAAMRAPDAVPEVVSPTAVAVSASGVYVRKYLQQLHEVTARNIIVYYSGWLQKATCSVKESAASRSATLTRTDS